MQKLTQFTVCLWMKSNEQVGTLFSYAVPGTDNELLLEYSGDFQLSIAEDRRLVIVFLGVKILRNKLHSWHRVRAYEF